MKKKYKLRPWVKIALIVIALIFAVIILDKALERYNRLADKCDSELQRICSHYEIEQMRK